MVPVFVLTVARRLPMMVVALPVARTSREDTSTGLAKALLKRPPRARRVMKEVFILNDRERSNFESCLKSVEKLLSESV
jgi:hypothetical protein